MGKRSDEAVGCAVINETGTYKSIDNSYGSFVIHKMYKSTSGMSWVDGYDFSESFGDKSNCANRTQCHIIRQTYSYINSIMGIIELATYQAGWQVCNITNYWCGTHTSSDKTNASYVGGATMASSIITLTAYN